MAIVQYQKLWETEERVRYSVSPVPEEKYGVEFHKITGQVLTNAKEATAVADSLKWAIVRHQRQLDPMAKKVTVWPDRGEFRL